MLPVFVRTNETIGTKANFEFALRTERLLAKRDKASFACVVRTEWGYWILAGPSGPSGRRAGGRNGEDVQLKPRGP